MVQLFTVIFNLKRLRGLNRKSPQTALMNTQFCSFYKSFNCTHLISCVKFNFKQKGCQFSYPLKTYSVILNTFSNNYIQLNMNFFLTGLYNKLKIFNRNRHWHKRSKFFCLPNLNIVTVFILFKESMWYLHFLTHSLNEKTSKLFTSDISIFHFLRVSSVGWSRNL